MYKVTWTLNKGIYAVGGAVYIFTQDIHSAMIGLLICIGIDTITGFISAPYRGQIRESAKLSRVVMKIITYFSRDRAAKKKSFPCPHRYNNTGFEFFPPLPRLGSVGV